MTEKPVGVAVLGLGNVGQRSRPHHRGERRRPGRPHRRAAGAARHRGAAGGRRPRCSGRAADRQHRGTGLPRRRRHRRRGDGAGRTGPQGDPGRAGAAASPSSPRTRRCWRESTGELAQAAENAHVDLYFEAAVAGAIPVIRPLTQSLAGDTVLRVAGIVNGTTNYILSEMDSTGADYADALADAERAGLRRGRPDRRRRGLRRRGQGRDPGVDRLPHPGDRRRRLPRGHHQGHPGRLRVRARAGLHDQAAVDLRADHHRRRAATSFGARLPGAGAPVASAGLGQRRVQRRRRRGRGGGPVDVLRPGRRRRADRIGGDG